MLGVRVGFKVQQAGYKFLQGIALFMMCINPEASLIKYPATIATTLTVQTRNVILI